MGSSLGESECGNRISYANVYIEFHSKYRSILHSFGYMTVGQTTNDQQIMVGNQRLASNNSNSVYNMHELEILSSFMLQKKYIKQAKTVMSILTAMETARLIIISCNHTSKRLHLFINNNIITCTSLLLLIDVCCIQLPYLVVPSANWPSIHWAHNAYNVWPQKKTFTAHDISDKLYTNVAFVR